jgi:hypothetical protein
VLTLSLKEQVMSIYRNGHKPTIGDRVVFNPENPLHLRRRPKGSAGTVYELGANLIDPMPGVVFVDWDVKLAWSDDDCFVCLLDKAIL